MYWRQAAGAAVLGVVAAWVVRMQVGQSLAVAAGTALVVYVAVRVLIATRARIQYWLGRGGHDSTRRHCGNCGQHIRRRPGDWITECKRCGWRPGLPGLRWLFYSVPAVHLRRSLSAGRVVVLLLATALILANPGVAALGGVSPLPEPQATQGDDRREPDNPVPPSPETPEVISPYEPPTDQQVDVRVDVSAVRREFLDTLNAERQDQGLPAIDEASVLQEMATAHAENMRQHDYIGHVQPDGTTIEQRFRDRGLLPACKIDTQSGVGYYPGAEVTAGTWLGRPVSAEWEEESQYMVTSSEELVHALFQEWMHSSEHRKVLMLEGVTKGGLGIAINDDGKVYAAYELCGTDTYIGE